MRIRSDGPHKTTVMVPNGSTGVKVSVTKNFTLPWANGSTGTILGVPFTIGVEISQLGSYSYTISGSTFRQKVFDAMLQEIAKSTPNLCPMIEFTVDYSYEEFRDVETLNYHRRQAAGEIINNPMTQIYSEFKGSPAVATTFTSAAKLGDDVWSFWHGAGASTGSLSIRLDAIWTAKSSAHGITHHDVIVKDLLGRVSSPVDNALQGAFSKLQDAELDVALMLAEGKETILYLRDLNRRAAKVLKAIQDPKEVWRYAPKAFASISKVGFAKALADAWLEARYAIRPLLIDIENTYAYLTGGKVTKRQDRYTYRKREGNSYAGTAVISVGGQPVTVNFSVEKTARAGVLSQAVIGVPGSNFGFMNWASIAFEKVKYSFIAAWILDFGGLLYRLNPNLTMKPLAVWTTEVSSVSYVATMEVDTPNGKQLTTSSGMYREKSRNPVTDMQPPLITLAINIDGYKLLDLVSIVGQIKTR